MCNFKSGIVLRDEREKGGFRLLMSPWTESHSDLEIIHNLREGKSLKFAKVEFSPESMATADKVETYKFKIDEERTPVWFDGEMQERVKEKMAEYIRSIIITGDVALLIGGQFIIAPGAKIECAKAVVILAMLGSSTVQMMWDSSTVKEMLDSSTVQMMWDSSTVKEMRDSSTVQMMWDSSTVQAMRGSSTVKEMLGSSTVQRMRDSSTVQAMLGSSTVKEFNSTLQILKDNRPK